MDSDLKQPVGGKTTVPTWFVIMIVGALGGGGGGLGGYLSSNAEISHLEKKVARLETRVDLVQNETHNGEVQVQHLSTNQANIANTLQRIEGKLEDLAETVTQMSSGGRRR